MTINPLKNCQVNGIATSLKAKGEGKVTYVVLDKDGHPRELSYDKAVYVPGLKTCLISPQAYFQANQDDNGSITGTRWHVIFHWGNGYEKIIPYTKDSNIPIMGATNDAATCHHVALMTESITAETNQNLMASQKDLL
jgi:hypothetical protein